MRLSKQQRDHYDENGFVIIENAIDLAGLELIRSAYQRAERERKPEWLAMVEKGESKGGYGNGPDAHTIRPDYSWDTTILELANNPRILPIIEELIGPDYQVTDMLYHNHHAGSRAHTRWHRDWPPWSHPQFTLKVKCFYALDDIHEDQGCLCIVPGTHKNPEEPPKDKYDKDNLTSMPGHRKIVMNAGDVIIWNVSCWHTGLPNTSTRDRRLVIYGYMPFFVKKWSTVPPDALVKWADTPMKRQLMGIHCVHGRRSWDRTDVEYLPDHQVIADAKKQ